MIRDIYAFVQEEEQAYQQDIEPVEGWAWSMKDHIRRSALYKNSQFDEDNDNRTKRPFRNIVLPLLNIQYRLEGFDVKDIDIYVSNPDNYYKSFLIKKYHDKWALEHGMDTLIDNIVQSYVDYGGTLVKNGKELEVVDLQTLAFADQTDILSGAFAIKHYYTPTQLRAWSAWNQDSVEFAIEQAEHAKKQDKENVESKTPTKYIEVYEVHGVFSDALLRDEDVYVDEQSTYSNQIHIISFYMDSSGRKQGLTFFKKREPVLPFKFLARDGGIFGRALGRGGVEELFEPQAWTNYSEIKIAHMLDSASKVIWWTTDPHFKNRNKLDDLEDNEVLTGQEQREFRQIDTTPRNIQLFYQNMDTFKDNADRISAAGDALQGEQPKSGTPFKLQELVTIENKGMHHHRRGQIATFLDEIYRDWVIPKLAKEAVKEQTFLSILSADEIQQIAQNVAQNRKNMLIKEKILKGELVEDGEFEDEQALTYENFVKAGKKRFIKILEGEFKQDELGVMTNIAGKQKNIGELTDRVVSYVRQLIATPQMRQDPEMVRLLNEILESAGLSPITFGVRSPSPMMEQQAGGTQALQQLGQANAERD